MLRDSLEDRIAPTRGRLLREKKFSLDSPVVMVRLAAARGARIAGRAALVAIWEARREAKTREAIVMV